MKSLQAIPLIALLIAASPGPAAAQEECKIDYGRPGQVKDAEGALKRFELLGQPEDKRKNFIKAVTSLTKDPEKVKSNPNAANMLLGRALVDLALLPDQSPTAKGAEIGYLSDSAATIDLLARADSAFDAVEAAIPACKDETEEPRRRAYAAIVNEAVNTYNGQQLDSAFVLTKRALMLYDGYKLSYIAYNILGNVQQSKDDYPAAIQSFRKMVDLTKGDTSLVDERKNTVMLVAQLMTLQAQSLEADARKKMLQDEVAFLQDFQKDGPDDPKLQSAISRAQLMSGDEEAARQLFNDMLTNPDKYSDQQLLEAGVGAFQADKNDVAATLFEAGLKKNPYSRDGLFNLAATYDALGQLDKMPPVLERLVAVDPANPENYKLWARYWQARAKDLKAERDKPGGNTEAATKAWDDANKELMETYTKFSDATVKVTFNLFSHDNGNHVLGGTVENLSDQDKNYTLKFEFLDASGTVLDTQEVSVQGVAAKGQKSFKVEVSGKPGVIAFRYGPIA